MKNFTLFYSLVLLCCANLWAQTGQIQGHAKDAGTQKPLVGALIQLDGGLLGAVTDDKGIFHIEKVPIGTKTLYISLLGYESQSQTVQVAENKTYNLDLSMSQGVLTLETVTISAHDAHHQQTISQIDLKLRPIVNSQEILRIVPGLFIGQHAGGGKAEQIFLRGFDIDHGTDIGLTVDGLPVNMASHAHGQGYADLHFVIPELVEQVDFEKGPYHADKGNFVTAGWVDFRTRDVLERNFVKLEMGQYGTARGVAALNLLGEKARMSQQNAYIGGEYSYTNSYFDAPQFFNRANVQGRYSGAVGGSQLSVTASHFWSRWNHSGQIPERSVADGSTSFWGSIDPTEGGETSRSNFNVQLFTPTRGNGLLKNQFYCSNYQFELYSNFTFFLEDALNGDQIRQKEGRNLLGYKGSYSRVHALFGTNARSNVGLQIRHDLAKDVELSNSRNRKITERRIQLGDVRETNAALYAEEDVQIAPELSLNIGLRYDFFHNDYTDRLENNKREHATAGIFSPKINLYYTPSQQFQFYLCSGKGFHSNDTRVVVPQAGKNILPAAYGSDLGLIWKPAPRLYVNAALWYLFLDQEFVYVGDAGVVEPSGRSRRYGVDFSARYQIAKHLFADADVNWTDPRSIDDPAGENYIPLAPRFSSVGGLTLTARKGFSGSLRYRYMADRPAKEDNSIVAKGYFVPDLQVNYARKNWEFSLNLQNLSNTRWKETQFATESRLMNETEPVEEIHFTPGTPFFARAAIALWF